MVFFVLGVILLIVGIIGLVMGVRLKNQGDFDNARVVYGLGFIFLLIGFIFGGIDWLEGLRMK